METYLITYREENGRKRGLIFNEPSIVLDLYILKLILLALNQYLIVKKK